jgi:Fe-S-cluster containining protein
MEVSFQNHRGRWQALKMMFIPWRYIADWKCNNCGFCCKAYSVVLNFQEWLNIVKNYGVETTFSGLDKLYLRRKSDGSCFFLYKFSDVYLCGLQHMKPDACKLWPFRVLSNPKYGHARDALYPFAGKNLYIYADSSCHGLQYGPPTWEFANYTVKEFAELAIGIRSHQERSKAKINPPQPLFQQRRLI